MLNFLEQFDFKIFIHHWEVDHNSQIITYPQWKLWQDIVYSVELVMGLPLLYNAQFILLFGSILKEIPRDPSLQSRLSYVGFCLWRLICTACLDFEIIAPCIIVHPQELLMIYVTIVILIFGFFPMHVLNEYRCIARQECDFPASLVALSMPCFEINQWSNSRASFVGWRANNTCGLFELAWKSSKESCLS